MKQIEILALKRQLGYVEITYQMTFTLPAVFGTGAAPIPGLAAIVGAYPDDFEVAVIPVDGTVLRLTETKPLDIPAPSLAQLKTKLQNRYAQVRAQLDGLTLAPFDNLAKVSWDGTAWS